MSLRNLQRRVARIEKSRKPRPSPFVLAYGSFEAFVEETYDEIVAGKLDRADMIVIVACLRRWETDGTWDGANSH